MSNIFADMLKDVTKVVRNEHEALSDERQLALERGDAYRVDMLSTGLEKLKWVLWLLECDYPEELYERYGDLLKKEDS